MGLESLVRANTKEGVVPTDELSAAIQRTLGMMAKKYETKANVDMIKALTGEEQSKKNESPLQVLEDLNKAGLGMGNVVEMHKSVNLTLAAQLEAAQKRIMDLENIMGSLKEKAGSNEVGMFQVLMEMMRQERQAQADLMRQNSELQQRNLELIIRQMNEGRGGPDPLSELGLNLVRNMVEKQAGNQQQDPRQELFQQIAYMRELQSVLGIGAQNSKSLDEKRLELEEKKLMLQMDLEKNEREARRQLDERKIGNIDGLTKTFSAILPDLAAVMANRDQPTPTPPLTAGTSNAPPVIQPPGFVYGCSSCKNEFILPRKVQKVNCPYCAQPLVIPMKESEAV